MHGPSTPQAPLAPPVDPAGMQELSDEVLDTFIRVRLALAGVDLSVLPESDPEAPADQDRVLRSARGFLRNTVPRLSRFELDPQEWPPVLYPSRLPEVIEREDVPDER